MRNQHNDTKNYVQVMVKHARAFLSKSHIYLQNRNKRYNNVYTKPKLLDIFVSLRQYKSDNNNNHATTHASPLYEQTLVGPMRD